MLARTILAALAATLWLAAPAIAQRMPSTAVQRPPYYLHDYYDSLDVYGVGHGDFPATDYPVYPVDGYEYGPDPYDSGSRWENSGRFDVVPDMRDYGGYDYLGYDEDFNYDAHDADVIAEPPPADRYDPYAADAYGYAPY